MSPVPFHGPDGHDWQVSLEAPKGLNEPVNVGPEDLVFKRPGARRVLEGIGFILGKPLHKLSQPELEGLFEQADKVEREGKRRRGK